MEFFFVKDNLRKQAEKRGRTPQTKKNTTVNINPQKKKKL